MRTFEIEMEIIYTKTLHVEARNADKAMARAKNMLLCTDELQLTDADLSKLAITAVELAKNSAHNLAPGDEREAVAEKDECFSCPLCGNSDEDEDPTLCTITGEPMGLDELMLHLSVYLEDAEDELDNLKSALSLNMEDAADNLDDFKATLSMNMEDAADDLDDLLHTLSSIYRFARAFLKAKSTSESADETRTPTVQ